MELEAAMQGWTPRRHRRNGGFWLRAEMEVDQASPVPRGPEFGFAAAVREPLVKLRRPEHEFERWDWDYFVWPHDRVDGKQHGVVSFAGNHGTQFTNLEMRDSDPEATLEADQKVSERFLNQITLQLESYEMYQHTQQQQDAAAWPYNHFKCKHAQAFNLCQVEDIMRNCNRIILWFSKEPCRNVISLLMPRIYEIETELLIHAANLEMRDSDPETSEEDQKASESFLNQCTLQLESYEKKQHTAALPCDHLQANLETRNTNAEATLQTDLKTKERSRRKQKRSGMDLRTQEQHNEKENEGAELFRTPMPVNKKAVGHRSARRRRVFAEANRSLDDDRARVKMLPPRIRHSGLLLTLCIKHLCSHPLLASPAGRRMVLVLLASPT
ncbi:hypothetical protein HU200_018788 [Digitaria exilis]|uniref:Uncharacterized protein n=1 Tax=Digitaria exilis TaxID=1010633 RepID=A0A835F4Q4_9POAL|nr:hypothetical protein HU200_018788 [Digitaria exilis]